MAWRALTISGLVSLLGSTAQAQEVPSVEQPAVKLHEVERGGYAGGAVGFLMVRPPGARTMGNGTVIGLSMGYDFARWIGVGFFGLAIDAVAPAGYTGLSGGNAQGDFAGIMPGAEVRLHLP